MKKNINRMKDMIRNKWKIFFTGITGCICSEKRKFLRYGISILISLLLVSGMNIVSSHIAHAVPDQNSYLAWGDENYAQISCFTSRSDGFTTEELMRFEYELHKTLMDNDKTEHITQWIDAYSGKGRLTVTNGNTSVEGTAYGVGNDFFLFHPLTLISGGYIDTDNVMKDYILLDEEASWRLFGSSDVAGLSVNINGEPHVVSGVFKRPNGRLNTASGNGEITFYVCYESLARYTENAAITTYEVMMRNPVKHYAFDYIKKYFQPDSEGEESTGNVSAISGQTALQREIKIVENSDRYSLMHKWEHLKNFGINTMNLNEISYPFWENIALAYESILTFVFFLQLLGGLAVVLCVILMMVQIIKYFKRFS